jgi:hypothetical protein
MRAKQTTGYLSSALSSASCHAWLPFAIPDRRARAHCSRLAERGRRAEHHCQQYVWNRGISGSARLALETTLMTDAVAPTSLSRRHVGCHDVFFRLPGPTTELPKQAIHRSGKMQTTRRTLISCLSFVFAVAIFVISTNTTSAAETIPVSLIRPPTVSRSSRPVMVRCPDDQYQHCVALKSNCDRRENRTPCLGIYYDCMRLCGG